MTALATYECGSASAPTLVLLHGGGLSSAEWTELAPALAERYRVIGFDARGCGASPPDPELRYGAATITDDLEAIRNNRGLDRCALVDHSFGAVAACVYAAEHPEVVTHLVLVDGGPAERKRPSTLDYPPLSFASRDDAARALAKLLPRGFPEWYLDTRFETAADGRLTWRSDMRGRVEWSRRGGEPLIPGLRPYIERVRAPALVLRGAESPLFPLETAVKIREVNPRVRVVEVPRAGHFVHIDRPDVVLDEILRHVV